MARKSLILSTGFTIFAMFFGAGNIIFPLALGHFTQDKNLFGVLGMIITAVLVPLTGLMGMLLYEGDYQAFFSRIGKIPGFIVTLLILGLIGPFGGIPRCITISYSTLTAFGLDNFNWMNLGIFSVLSCLVIFLFTYRPGKILTLLGYVLTPILLISLGVIIVKGFFQMPAADHVAYSNTQTFFKGFLDGYNTMDLLASFFFSSAILLCLRKGQQQKQSSSEEKTPTLQQRRSTMSVAIKGSLIAACLLAAVYIAFSFLAAGFSAQLDDVPNHQLLGALAYQVLGPYAGLLAGVVVSFACLTTEIALTLVFAEFLSETLFKGKLSYLPAVGLTLGCSFLISTLHFEGISAFVAPILQVCYPALIVLTLLNIFSKLFDFKVVKPIFYSAMGVGLLAQLL